MNIFTLIRVQLALHVHGTDRDSYSGGDGRLPPQPKSTASPKDNRGVSPNEADIFEPVCDRKQAFY